MVGGPLHSKDTSTEAMDDGLRADLRAAYERGRHDARASRKRHPLLMTLTFLAAVVGVGLLALAAVHGSFGRAGGLVDQQIAVAADQAGPAARNAADNANQGLHDAARSARTDKPS
jgi:hypothetical protein